MKTPNSLLISSFCIFVSLFSASAHAATFTVLNNCSYTIWAAALPGGGQRLDGGQTWNLNVSPNTSLGRIWGRTNCSFDSDGTGKCLTGDCAGNLECTSDGTPPKTTAEYILNQRTDRDSYYISLVDGFNVPMQFGPSSAGSRCRRIRCTANIVGECPEMFKTPGGCTNPSCSRGECGRTESTEFFKQKCPDAHTYSTDISFTCKAGTDYKVVFCP